MSLLKLANELILSIAKCLDSERDINHFVQTCRRVYHVANHYLYRYHLRERGGRGVAEAVKRSQYTAVEKFMLQAEGWKATDNLIYDLALLQAAERDLPEIAELLLDQGGNVNKRNNRRESLLFLAIESYKGDGKLVRLLLDRGAKVEDKWRTRSSLCEAAMLGWTPLVEMLLDYGADINAPAKKGPKAAELAIRQGHVETAMLLVSRGASTSGRGSSGMDLLCRAAKHGSEELVKKLIDHGVDPRRQDDRAMWCALANGHMSIVHLLLRHGANISPGYEEWERRTALCAAIKNGHVHTAMFLIEQGVDVNKYNGQALREAAGERCLEIVTALLNKGADVHACSPDFYVYSALGCAVLNQDQEMVKLLKENGASFPDRETSRMLQNLYATSNSLEAINLFLDAGANINAIGGDYGSLLQFAIHNGDMPFVYSLIERGASVHLASEDHETPLGRASAREGNAEDLELLRVLIDEHGADVNQFIEGGLTPIQRAVWAGSEKIFDFLVSRGANIDINRSQHANVIHCTRIEFVTRAQELLNYEV